MLIALALAAAAPPVDLTGTWAATMEVVTSAKIPVLGKTDVHTYQWMVATITPKGEGFRVHHDACAFRAESKPSLASTSFAKAFVDSIPDRDYDVSYVTGDPGVVARMHVGFVAVGWDPARGAFPETLDAPSVIDWDRDGTPAATVQLKIPIFGRVDVYQAQAQDLWFDLSKVTADVIEGTVRIEGMRQRTLGASNRLFIQNPALKQDPARSKVRFTRAAAGAGCAVAP